MRYGPASFLLLACLLAAAPARAADEAASGKAIVCCAEGEGLAMQGKAAEPPGFTSFPYVNANAPQGGVLRLGMTGSYDNLNPFTIKGRVAAGMDFFFGAARAKSLVYETLLARSWGEPFTMYPLLAERVEVTADRSMIRFHLDPRATFSDGVPVTADDVRFSFEALRDKGRPNHRSFYKQVDSLETPDAHTVTFHLARLPDGGPGGSYDRELPLILSLMPILPKHAMTADDIQKTTLQAPIGSGPYLVGEIVPGRRLSFVKNPDYWGRGLPVNRGLWNFTRIVYDYYRDDGVALEAFLAGQYDVRSELDAAKWRQGYNGAALDRGDIIRAELTHHRPEPVRSLVFNLRRPPFDRLETREGLDTLFEAEWIGPALFGPGWRRIDSFFANSELANPLPAKTYTSFRQRLSDALEDFAKVGYTLKDGRLVNAKGEQLSLEMLLGNAADERVALAYARRLQDAGIDARVRLVDSAQFQSRMNDFDFDMAGVRWQNSLSPGQEQRIYWGSAFADTPGSRNYAGLKSGEVDDLVTKLTAATSREELVAIVKKLDHALLEAHIAVPFFMTGTDQVAYRRGLAVPLPPSLYGALLEAGWWDDAARRGEK